MVPRTSLGNQYYSTPRTEDSAEVKNSERAFLTRYLKTTSEPSEDKIGIVKEKINSLRDLLENQTGHVTPCRSGDVSIFPTLSTF
jgi:hypothetical protein